MALHFYAEILHNNNRKLQPAMTIAGNEFEFEFA